MIFTANTKGLGGELTVPGDKSISHRAVMFGALSKGTTSVTHFLKGADCLSTIHCFRKMGISIEEEGEQLLIHGQGLHGLTKPSGWLDAGNSGTTTRLLSGILSGQSFSATIHGDASIQSRPMGRIMEPLKQMGAHIVSLNHNGCAPLEITGGSLRGISYQSPVASAQVKSAVLLAGLYAEGITSVTEPALSRNHTELMLRGFGAQVDICPEARTASIHPEPELWGQQVQIPGDISSAAYFIAAATITPHSEVLLRQVGINPTRAGMLQVCEEMGADITLLQKSCHGGEPAADLLIRSSDLTGTVIEGERIPTLIDELPILAVLACFAKGTTIIRDAQELKVKESNRIAVMVQNLSAMGAHITATEDGMIIEGGAPLHGAVLESHKDHRVAMSLAVAALQASGETRIQDASCVDISYPGFYGDLQSLSR